MLDNFDFQPFGFAVYYDATLKKYLKSLAKYQLSNMALYVWN